MPFESGTKLGRYEILESLPSGAAGEVYKASDTQLNRTVTIHVLPPQVSVNAELKQRLERESQVIASLNHPHISRLFDVGSHEGANFVVMEYLEGQTLVQRLTRGPLELSETLRSAIAIADALDKAHRQGITHRGLNPSNILLTPTGIKLLNFGIAAVREECGDAGSASLLTTRTAAAPLMTVPAPDAPYLAPEQIEGKATDARTDIFAFGAILYEMLTGQPAFEGKTQVLLIAAITTVDPDPVTKTQPLTPPALEYVVKRCLAKDPRQRLQTAWDLMSQLQWIEQGGSQIGVSAPVAARRQKRDRQYWIAAAAGIVLALSLLPSGVRYLRGAPDSEPARFIASGITTTGAPVSLSPDGRWIITSAGQGAGSRGVNALLLNSVAPQLLIKDNNVVQPFWSPDSKSIGFFEDGKLKRADVASGAVQILCEAPAPIGSASWGSQGVILFSSKHVLNRVLATGGQSTTVTTLNAGKQETEHLAPYFLPDGNHYLFLSLSSTPSESGLYVASLDSSERTRLLDIESKAAYVEPGYLIFNRGNTLFAQGFDASKRVLKGEPIRLADGVPVMPAGPNASSALGRWANFTVSQTGVLAFRTGSETTAQTASSVPELTLFWFDRTGGRAEPVGPPAGYAGIDIAPDGKRFAVHRHESNGGDNWFFDPAQGRMQRLTFDASQDNSSPIWSPDGKQIAFGSLRSGKWELYVKPADGTGREELLLESESPKAPMTWSRDGKLLVYWTVGAGGSGDIFAVPVAGDRKPVALVQTNANELFPQISSDGKWMAYQSNETGRAEIYVRSFPEGPGKWQVSTDGGQFPRWRGDTKELYFAAAPNVMAVDIGVSGGSVQPGVPHPLFALGSDPSFPNHPTSFNRYAVTPDGQRFLIAQSGNSGPAASGGLSDVLITAADSASAPASANGSVTVVLNWLAAVKTAKH